MNIEEPTPDGIIFTALRLIQQCAKAEYGFLASAEVFSDFSVISELPIDDSTKVSLESHLVVLLIIFL